MRRIDTPKKVTLPNGTTFYAKYAGVPRSQLPNNVILKRKYKRRAVSKGRRRRAIRKGQRGRNFLSSLKKNSQKSISKTNRKNCSKKAVNYAPQLYNLGTSKIKNKTARDILQSDAATNLLNNLITRYSGE